MNEVWKPVRGYEDRYEVSNTGKVRSLNYRHKGITKELKPTTEGKGYLMVGLCRDGSMKWGKIHRLVAEAFLPNPENKREVNHIDGDKKNNVVDNLEWVTASENMKHAFKIGLIKPDPEWGRTLGTKYGKESARKHAEECRKPIWAINSDSGYVSFFESAAQVEKILGINHSSVPRVCDGRQKSAKGYRFIRATKKA